MSDFKEYLFPQIGNKIPRSRKPKIYANVSVNRLTFLWLIQHVHVDSYLRMSIIKVLIFIGIDD